MSNDAFSERVFNGRADLRFGSEETRTLLHYFSRNPVQNKSAFFKQHFWRSFMLINQASLEDNVAAIGTQNKLLLQQQTVQLQLLLLLLDSMRHLMTPEQQAVLTDIAVSIQNNFRVREN